MRKVAGLLLAGLATAALGGCAYDAEYGYAGGYGPGPGAYAYGPEYDAYYGDPSFYGAGWGWYGDYWYPGSGVFVYDRYGHGRRWSGREQSYWHDHGPRPGGPANPWHGRPGGNWHPPAAPMGHGFTNGPGRFGGGHHGH